MKRIAAAITSWFRDPQNTVVMACSALGCCLAAATAYAIATR